MDNIDLNTIVQLAPAVFVLMWIIYRQDLRIDRLEKACIEFKERLLATDNAREGIDRKPME